MKLFITLSMLEYAGMSINDKTLQPPIIKLRMAFLFAAFSRFIVTVSYSQHLEMISSFIIDKVCDAIELQLESSILDKYLKTHSFLSILSFASFIVTMGK